LFDVEFDLWPPAKVVIFKLFYDKTNTSHKRKIQNFA